PAAGRVTAGGVHWLERDGERVPIGATEYAGDRVFGYRSSRLLEWAQERSEGRLAAGDGLELGLEELRGPGGAAALAAAIARGQAVLAPDAETAADLGVIAAGLRAAWRRARS